MAAQTLIRISERSAGDGTFAVRVSFGGDTEYDVNVASPADDTSEQELAWYLEEHLRYPFLDKDPEAQAVGQITSYGTPLSVRLPVTRRVDAQPARFAVRDANRSPSTASSAATSTSRPSSATCWPAGTRTTC
jgi:hypothetical protein